MSSAPGRAVGGDPYRWVILTLVTLAQASVILVGLSMGPLAPFIQKEFQLSRTELGLLVTALYLGGALTSLPTGSLTDRLGVRTVLGLAPLVVGGLGLAIAHAPAYAWMFVLLFCAGLGYGGVNPPTTAAVVIWFSGRFRGTAMGIKQTGFALGSAIGGGVLPLLAAYHGWRGALTFSSLAVIGWAIVCLAFYRSGPRGARPKTAQQSPLQVFRLMLSEPNLRQLSICSCLLAGTQVTTVSFLVYFLVDRVGLSVVSAGAILAIANILGVVGRVAWGALSDQRPDGRRHVLALVNALSAIGLVATAAVGAAAPAWAPYALAVVLGLTTIGWNGVFMALAGELTLEYSAGGVFGFLTSAQFLGILLGSPAFGAIVDATGSYAVAWLVFAGANALNTLMILRLREKATA